MTLTLGEVSELDGIIKDLEDVSKGLLIAVENIDGYSRGQAANSMAFNAGIITGLTMKLKQLKG